MFSNLTKLSLVARSVQASSVAINKLGLTDNKPLLSPETKKQTPVLGAYSHLTNSNMFFKPFIAIKSFKNLLPCINFFHGENHYPFWAYLTSAALCDPINNVLDESKLQGDLDVHIKMPQQEKKMIRRFYKTVIDEFSQVPSWKKFVEEGKQAKLRFVVVGHLVPTIPFLLEGLNKIGKVVAIVPKGSSSDAEIIKWYELFCKTQNIKELCAEKIPKKPDVKNWREYMDKYGDEFLDEQIKDDENLVVIDIGGYFSTTFGKIAALKDDQPPYTAVKNIPESSKPDEIKKFKLACLKEHQRLNRLKNKIIGIVEDTENGEQKYKRQIAKHKGELPFPLISVARSAIKNSEDYNVGKAITDAADHLLRTEDYTHLAESKTILVIGYGKVGSAAAKVAAEKTRGSVLICETNPTRRLLASAHSFRVVDIEEGLKQADLIISCTGNKALKEAHIELMKPYVTIASCTSHDDEFDPTFLKSLQYDSNPAKPDQQSDTRVVSPIYSVGARQIKLLNNGNSTNFIQKAVHGYFIHGVLASLLVSAMQLCGDSIEENHSTTLSKKGIVDFNELYYDIHSTQKLSTDSEDSSEKIQGYISSLLMNIKFNQPVIFELPKLDNKNYIRRPTDIESCRKKLIDEEAQYLVIYGERKAGKTKLLHDLGLFLKNDYRIIYSFDANKLFKANKSLNFSDLNMFLYKLSTSPQQVYSQGALKKNQRLVRPVNYSRPDEKTPEVEFQEFFRETKEQTLILIDNANSENINQIKQLFCDHTASFSVNSNVQLVITTQDNNVLKKEFISQSNVISMKNFDLKETLDYFFKNIDDEFKKVLSNSSKKYDITKFALLAETLTFIHERGYKHCDLKKFLEDNDDVSFEELMHKIREKFMSKQAFRLYKLCMQAYPNTIGTAQLLEKSGLETTHFHEAYQELIQFRIVNVKSEEKLSVTDNAVDWCMFNEVSDLSQLKNLIEKFESEKDFKRALLSRQRFSEIWPSMWRNEQELLDNSIAMGKLKFLMEDYKGAIKTLLKITPNSLSAEQVPQLHYWIARSEEKVDGKYPLNNYLKAFEAVCKVSNFQINANLQKILKESSEYLINTTQKHNDKLLLLNKLEQILEKIKKNEEGNNRGLCADIGFQLGVLNKNLRKYDDAEKYYKYVLNLYQETDPDYETVLNKIKNNLGVICKHQGKYDDALKYYNDALKFAKYSRPETIGNIHMNMGVIYRNQHKTDPAKEAYSKAEKEFKTLLEPDNKRMLNLNLNQLILYIDTRDVENTESKLRQVKELETKVYKHGNPDIKMVEARYYWDIKSDSGQAEELISKYVNKCSDDFKSLGLTLRAEILQESDREQAEKNIRDAHKLLSISNQSVDAQRTRQMYKQLVSDSFSPSYGPSC